MRETEQDKGDTGTSIETNPYGWQKSHPLLTMEKQGGVFVLKTGDRDLSEHFTCFHGLTFVFDESGMVAGLTGQLGAMRHLLVPSINKDGQPKLNVSKGYHNITRENGKYYGQSGSSPKEEIVITVQKPR